MAKGLAREGWDKDFRESSLREDSLENFLRFGTYEHKRDYYCVGTGNLSVEIRQGDIRPGMGRPSGISVTQSEAWVMEFAKDCYVIGPTRKWKKLVKRIYRQRGSRMLGDYGKFENVLVPWASLLTLDEVEE